MKSSIRFFTTVIVLPVFFFFSSCAYQLDSVEEQKRSLFYHNISSLVVVPFLNHTDDPRLSYEVTDIFAKELGRFDEVSIVHPQMVIDYLKQRNLTVTETNIFEVGKELAKAFDVQAVLMGAVTEFNPYFPPVLGISFEVYDISLNEKIITVSETYDAQFNYVRNRVNHFGGTMDMSTHAFGNEIVMQKTDLYIRFVCHDLIQKNL